MSFLDRLPFLPKHQGKRELVFLVVFVAAIVILGFVGGYAGILYKDVPHSTPTATISAPATPHATPPGH